MSDIYTLLCEKDIPMAKVTLPKICSFLKDTQKLYIFDDGSFTDIGKWEIQNLSNKIQVVTKYDREEYVLSKINRFPNIIKYRNSFPLAFKLVDIPLFARETKSRYTYTDSDIIYYNKSDDYFNRQVNTFLRTDSIKISIQLKYAMFKYKWSIPYKFNSGYFSFDTLDYDLEFIEYFLNLPEVYNIPWLTEQTCWALMFGKAGESFCPSEQQFICREDISRLNKNTVAVHLISNLKNRVYDWGSYDFIKETEFPNLVFEPSRNVNYLDVISKSFKRLVYK